MQEPTASAPIENPPYLNAYWQNATLVTVRRDGTGRLVSKQLPAEFCFFVQSTDLEKRPEAVRIFRESRHCVGFKVEGPWTRVRWRTRDHALGAARFIETTYKIKTYEADVTPTRRWMLDHDVQIAKPRRVFLDIETDSRVPFSRMREARILCWALVDEQGEAVSMTLESDTDEAERDLLRALWVELEPFDQVIGWNLDRFDKPMIISRSEQRGIKFNDRRYLWLDHLVLFRRMNIGSAESGDEKQSMALDAVAKSLKLGGKTEGITGARSWELWAAGGIRREQLEDYCTNDADLMRLIEERTGYVELLHTLCDVTHVFPDTWGIRPTAQVDAFLLRLGRDRGMHFPTHFATDATNEQFAGAYVMEPTTRGIERGVHVADFASMYPSMILTWNMSPETHRPDVRLQERAEGRPLYLSHIELKRFPIPPGHCATATDVVYVNEPRGLLALALEDMLRLRKHWSTMEASLPPGTPESKDAGRRSKAYKIAANSFYGVVGSPSSRHFARDVAESVTQSGVWLIKATDEAAQAGTWTRAVDPTAPICKFRVVYADTDSIFATGVDEETFGRFVAYCNDVLYPSLLREKGVPDERNRIKIAYEKAFERLVMVSKKRYAAKFLHYKGTRATAESKLEIKGLEYKRGDTAKLARELQKEVVELVVGQGCEDIAELAGVLDRWLIRILHGALELGDVKLSKRISKPLREYKRRITDKGNEVAAPAHIVIARELAKRGQDMGEGVRVEYVITDGEAKPMTAIPACDFVGEFDRFYLWENLIFPATQRFLVAAFPSEGWHKWERVRPAKVKAPKAPTKKSIGKIADTTQGKLVW